MYFALGICITLALLLLLNLAASLAASLVWLIVRRFAHKLPAQTRARLIFALRIFPLMSALLFIFGFLLPSYILFEPAVSDEIVSLKLAALALLSAIGVGFAVRRVFGTWWRTSRLIKEWTRRGTPLSAENIKLPVVRIYHPFPVIAVVGIFRPRMFIADQIFDLLDDEELEAAIVHEFGHLAARDNFKRAFLRVCRDFIIFPIGNSFDRLWAETAEAAADEYALSIGGNRTALNLAAALVKIARIVPENSKPAMPLGAFLVDEETADVSRRVRQLVRLTENRNDFARQNLNFSFLLWSAVVLFLLPILWLATNPDFLAEVHKTTEIIVAVLQ